MLSSSQAGRTKSMTPDDPNTAASTTVVARAAAGTALPEQLVGADELQRLRRRGRPADDPAGEPPLQLAGGREGRQRVVGPVGQFEHADERDAVGQLADRVPDAGGLLAPDGGEHLADGGFGLGDVLFLHLVAHDEDGHGASPVDPAGPSWPRSPTRRGTPTRCDRVAACRRSGAGGGEELGDQPAGGPVGALVEEVDAVTEGGVELAAVPAVDPAVEVDRGDARVAGGDAGEELV